MTKQVFLNGIRVGDAASWESADALVRRLGIRRKPHQWPIRFEGHVGFYFDERTRAQIQRRSA